jgi:hypothetical protein
MAYGLKYYFVDKKLVGTTDTTYTFEILEDGYSGSTTEWVGVDIRRQFEELSFRRIQNIQKSSCGGVVRVVDATQRSAIETIAGSEIGDYKVQLKRDGTVIWIGLVVPDLISIGEQNYGNQSAEIIAKDLFFTGNFPLTTLIPDTRGIEKAIVLMADILDTLGYGLDIVSYTSWIENNLTQSDDILNQSYHEKERFRIYGESEGEDDRPLTNQQALEYILKSYGLILRQVNGAWNLVQITAFSNPASVRRYVYNSSGTQTSSSTSYSLGSSAVSDELYVLGNSGNNYFAGVKVARSKFEHDSIIQGIKFNREYWIDDASEISKSQYWQADGTGNLELSFTTWFAKTTDTDLGNPVVMTVSIYVDTGGTDYYWNGTSWVTSPATIDVEVQETYSTTDSDGNYLYKNTGISIVTDPIPDPADGTLYVKLTPDALQPNYAYWYLRDLVFDLKYSDTVEGISSAILYELEQTGNYSDDYDYGTYYFGDGPTSASLSALKDSSRALLSQWKRAGDVSTTNHQNLVLNEILNVRRNQRRNIRATLYGEYEPDDILSYDSASFFFLGGSWSSQAYQWRCNFIELNVEEDTDTLTAFYITDGSGTSSGAVGSTGGSTGTSSLYLEKGKNLSDVPTPATARTNLGLGTGDSPTFAGLTVNGSISVTGNVDGRDVSADGADLDELYTTIGLSALTASEVDQLENIGSTTISATQWGYLGVLDQNLRTTDAVTFSTVDTGQGANELYAMNQDVQTTDDVTFNGLTANGTADLNSTLNVQGVLTTQDNILDDGFSEGWSGTNWRIKADGSAELKELRVRGALRVYEFIAKQISTIGGSEILSIANGRVESVDNVSSPKTITIDNVGSPATSFQAGDLWIIQEVDINSGSVTSVYGEVDAVVSGNVLQVTVTSGDLSQVEQGNIIVAYGHTDDSARQNVMYRNVDASEDNLIMRLQTGITEFSKLQDEANTRVAFGDLGPKPGESIGYSGLDSETFGFFAGSNSGGHILATSSGLFLKDGSTTLAQLTSNTFKVGNGTKYVEFDGTDLDVQAEDFKLEAGELVIDSSLDKKIVISNDDEEIIAIGDFVFGTEVEDTSTASASSSSTTATLTNAIPTNSDTNMDTGIGTLNSNVAQDSPIVTLSRTYNVTGKWVRVQFDYNAPPFDDSAFNEYAVGFSITYFGEQIQELNRNPEDSSAVSGSVDKTLFVPDTATFNTIQVQSLASSGGLSSSDEHSKINVSNLSVTVYDDTYSYTDIGNDGFRVYNSGGRKKIEFKDGNATATLDQLSIGSWDFELASNGDLVLKYEGTTVQTFTKP